MITEAALMDGLSSRAREVSLLYGQDQLLLELIA